MLDGPWRNRSSVELPIPPDQRSVVVRMERGPTRYIPAEELAFVADEREALDVAVNAVTFVCQADNESSVSQYIRSLSS